MGRVNSKATMCNHLIVPPGIALTILDVDVSRDACMDPTCIVLFGTHLNRTDNATDRFELLKRADREAYNAHLGECHLPPQICM